MFADQNREKIEADDKDRQKEERITKEKGSRKYTFNVIISNYARQSAYVDKAATCLLNSAPS